MLEKEQKKYPNRKYYICSINELVDEILSIYCLEKQQRKMAIAEENEILSEEAKKAGWKSGVMNI